jgi:hypothetical protein
VVIDHHIEDGFEFVADPSNDPVSCANMLAVKQLEGTGPDPGAR